MIMVLLRSRGYILTKLFYALVLLGTIASLGLMLGVATAVEAGVWAVICIWAFAIICFIIAFGIATYLYEHDQD